MNFITIDFFLAGFSNNLPIQLVQDYNIPFAVAKHLTVNYGGRALEVCQIVLEDDPNNNHEVTNGDGVVLKNDRRTRTPFFSSPSPRPVVCELLVQGYPYLTSEVVHCDEIQFYVQRIILPSLFTA